MAAIIKVKNKIKMFKKSIIVVLKFFQRYTL